MVDIASIGVHLDNGGQFDVYPVQQPGVDVQDQGGGALFVGAGVEHSAVTASQVGRVDGTQLGVSPIDGSVVRGGDVDVCE